MKYMGSKRYMLLNGLGTLIKQRARHADRIVDLFSGASYITWFVAEKIDRPVLAVDLQCYSRVLAEAIILREKKVDSESLKEKWIERVREAINSSTYYKVARRNEEGRLTRKKVIKARLYCRKHRRVGLMWRSYGGYYFSPSQALTLDLMRKYLPERNPARSLCLAALISSASNCIASPGHTAQPFQPTKGAKKYLQEAWAKDPLSLASEALDNLASRYAKRIGRATTADAMEVAKFLREGDLVIIDPPYSSVQYSRFYHVLETIARGRSGRVSGNGRYPSISMRPQSRFCNKGQSKDALRKLLRRIASKQAKAILTFPAGKASNGLSGRMVEKIASTWFKVSKSSVPMRTSTWGGNNELRRPGNRKSELILSLTPRENLVD